MLIHRLRRWSNNIPTLGEYMVFSGQTAVTKEVTPTHGTEIKTDLHTVLSLVPFSGEHPSLLIKHMSFDGVTIINRYNINVLAQHKISYQNVGTYENTI